MYIYAVINEDCTGVDAWDSIEVDAEFDSIDFSQKFAEAIDSRLTFARPQWPGAEASFIVAPASAGGAGANLALARFVTVQRPTIVGVDGFPTQASN